jgi:radical SAM protein with 4Fe4S-binding SPASM domain
MPSLVQQYRQWSRFLTAKRLVNMILLYLSYHLSRWLKRPLVWGLPSSIAIEPTTSCNLRCPECPSGLRSFTRPIGMLQPTYFSQMLQQVAPHVGYLTFYFQGEPYLNPNFLDMVAEADRLNVFTSTSTNAHYLTSEMAKRTIESGLQRLIISIDGTTQETYQQYRVGGTLSKVIEGTKQILHWRKELKSQTPEVIFQFLVVKPNEHQIEEVATLAAELGVDDIWYKTAQVYDYEGGNELIPTIEKYSRYRKQADGRWTIKNKLLNQCWRMWQSCVITWDGAVVPCCFDKDASYKLGHIGSEDGGKRPFKDIWFSQPYQDFRQNLLIGRSQIDICKNCTEGTTVWVD